MQQRDHDIVLFGATGFTGRLIAEYLAGVAPEAARIAVAGRDKVKLEELAGGLGREVAVVEADVTDLASMRAMAESTRVLITTVGPYTLHGEPAVAACAAAGTDYLDLCGEPEFFDRTWLEHHATAEESGARLIHACGFDSIPHDLGAQFTVEQLPSGLPMTIRGYARMNGTFSGGTAASALQAMSRSSQTRAARSARLAAEVRPQGRKARVGSARPGKSSDTGRWALPMPTIDPKIVVASALSLEAYGPDFSYSHLLDCEGPLAAAGTTAGIAAIAGLSKIPAARRALSARVPQGTGPSEEKRAASWFKVRFFGESGGERAVTEVAGGDPGYTETAKMISEAALCLAFDSLPQTSGQVTTAAAMGSTLRNRLDAAGITFRVLPLDIGGAAAPVDSSPT